jgi:hypothetical protein
MFASTLELAQVREVVTSLLDELCLDAYLFEVEPREGQWEVTVECAVAEGWERVRLTADKVLLLQGMDDGDARARLLGDWRAALSGCKLKP